MDTAISKNLIEKNEPNSGFLYKERLSNKAYFDLAIVLFISLVFLLFSIEFDFYEKVYIWSRQYDLFEIDELLIATFIFFPGLIWFAIRRWQEASLSYKKSNEAFHALEKTQVNLQKTLKENRSLVKRLDKIQEEERQRIAVDLHDIFGQHLTAIHANASTLQLKLDKNENLKTLTKRISSSSEQLSQLTRLMFNELRPPVLENIGLTAALKNYISNWLESHHEYKVEFNSEGCDKNIPISKGLILYRALQEALTNIIKHSNAKNIQVSIKHGIMESKNIDSYTVLEIVDDGVGFDNASQNLGLGLIGMRERVLNSNGEFKIDSKKKIGTRIWMKIPEKYQGEYDE